MKNCWTKAKSSFVMAEGFVRQIRAGDAQRALERGVILEGRLAPLIRMLYHAANTHS